jgi:hypothetical protein
MVNKNSEMTDASSRERDALAVAGGTMTLKAVIAGTPGENGNDPGETPRVHEYSIKPEITRQ